LLRLARGTGVDGLGAMRPRAGDLLRPLLRLRRPDVHRFVLLEGLPSVRDPHNLAPAVRRNVARHRVLPALEAMGPDPVGALTRLADLACDDAAAIAPLVAEVVAGARRVGRVVALRTRTLAEAPVAIARRAVREVLAEVGDGPPPSAAAVSRVLDLRPGGGLDLPGGVRATAGGGWLALAPAGRVQQEPGELCPGDTLVWDPAAVGLRWLGPGAESEAGGGDTDGQIALELTGAWSPPPVEVPDALVPPGGVASAATLVLPEDVERVVVRHRRPGDRLRLSAGTRRLKDLYVDAGVPRPVRSRWPVVADERDDLLWVPGVAADLGLVRRARHRPAGLLALASPPPGTGPPGLP
jgi:tRNA(Ile)-lysidine synthase